MKLAGFAVLLLGAVPAGSPVSFEPGSVRVDGAEITDPVLTLAFSPEGFVLASRCSVEPLDRPVSVALGPGRVLVLEPGVRISREDGAFALTVHRRRRVELEGAGEKFIAVVPVRLEITDQGWKVAGRDLAAGALAARRPQQDDVDQNLDQLGESAKRILNTPKSRQEQARQAKRKGNEIRKRKPIPEYLTLGDFLLSDAVDSSAVTALLHASPTGF